MEAMLQRGLLLRPFQPARPNFRHRTYAVTACSGKRDDLEPYKHRRQPTEQVNRRALLTNLGAALALTAVSPAARAEVQVLNLLDTGSISVDCQTVCNAAQRFEKL